MRALINKKIRNTDKMDCRASREGNPNDCYSSYTRIMKDNRDNTYYLWTGNFWAGLGPDHLEAMSPKEILDLVAGKTYGGYGIAWDLDEEEEAFIESLLENA